MPAPRVDHFRTQARIAYRTRVSVESLGATFEEQSWVVNIGLGGLCFEISDGFEIGQRPRLEVELPGLWDRLTLHGEVAWSTPGPANLMRVGVRFTRPSGKTLRLLAENLVLLV